MPLLSVTSSTTRTRLWELVSLFYVVARTRLIVTSERVNHSYPDVGIHLVRSFRVKTIVVSVNRAFRAGEEILRDYGFVVFLSLRLFVRTP